MPESAKAIDAIIYSSAPPQQMIDKLGPFVAVMNTVSEFKNKSGLDLGICMVTGPGVMDCTVEGCGLMLVIDPNKQIRIIRRAARGPYSELSISRGDFKWRGYRRWYPR